MRALREVEPTGTQIEALPSAAELAEAAWWNNPVLQRRPAALLRARRTLIDARSAPVGSTSPLIDQVRPAAMSASTAAQLATTRPGSRPPRKPMPARPGRHRSR